MTRDATQIARDFARDEERRTQANQSPYNPQRGTLTIWDTILDMVNGVDWLLQSQDVLVQFTAGAIITTDQGGDKEIIYPQPGWYLNFVPDRERE